MKKNIAVLISGRGSNLKALIDASRNPRYPAKIALVIADKEAPGLQYAKENGIPSIIISPKHYINKQSFEDAIHNALKGHNVELVVLAGYMKILSQYLIEKWPNKIINIHPSLLPLFKGLNTHQQAYDAGVKFHGATIHFVTSELDSGPIITQDAIYVYADDTPGTLADRVLMIEHPLLVNTVEMLLTKPIKIKGSRAFFDLTRNQL